MFEAVMKRGFLMDEKDTKERNLNVGVRLSSNDFEMAQYIMRSFGIKTISALIRELIRGLYEYITVGGYISEKEEKNV